MVKYTFNKELLEHEFKSLSHAHQVAFAAACSERMLPNYSEFSNRERWGDVAILEHVMDQIWKHILKNHLSTNEIKQYMKTCEALTPNSEDFLSIYASFAIDASCSLFHILSYFLDGETKHLLRVSEISRATVDLFVQEKENMHPLDPELEEKILNDPIMIKELERQEEDIEFLKNDLFLNQQMLKNLRSRSKGKANIGTAWRRR